MKKLSLLSLVFLISSCANIIVDDLSNKQDNQHSVGSDSFNISIDPPSEIFIGNAMVVKINMSTTQNSTLKNSINSRDEISVNSVNRSKIHYLVTPGPEAEAEDAGCRDLVYNSNSIYLLEDSTVSAIICDGDIPVFGPTKEYYNFVKFQGDWEQIASNVSTGTETSLVSSLFDSNDNPIVAYRQNSNIKIKKLVNNIWQDIGSSTLPNDYMTNMDITIDSNDHIYIAYRGNAERMANVIMFDGSTWTRLGAVNFSNFDIDDIQIAISPNNIPYVAIQDGTDANGYNRCIRVLKYDKNTNKWIDIPMLDRFSSMETMGLDIQFDKDSKLIMAYSDHKDDADRLNVMQFTDGEWSFIGNEDISEAEAWYLSLTIDKDNDIYIGFKDIANSSKASVLSFNKTLNKWEYIGLPGFSTGAVDDISLKISQNGVPVAMFADSSVGRGIMVMNFNGTQWEEVANRNGLPNGMIVANQNSLSLDSNNQIYIAFMSYNNNYQALLLKLKISPQTPGVNNELTPVNTTLINNTTTTIDFNNDENHVDIYYTTDGSIPTKDSTLYTEPFIVSGNNQTLEVKAITISDLFLDDSKLFESKYIFRTEDNWHSLGQMAFSTENSENIASDMDSTGKIYLAFKNKLLVEKTSVMSYNKDSNTWNYVGQIDISDDKSSEQAIAINNNDVPYIAFSDYNKKWAATVMKYNKNTDTWQVVGHSGFTSDDSKDLSLAFDSSNTPYLAYQDPSSADKVRVFKFDGDSWIALGDPISSGSASYIQIKIMNIDGHEMPYVLYADNDKEIGGKLIISRFVDNKVWETLGGNPVSSGPVSSGFMAKDKDNLLHVAYFDSEKKIQVVSKYITDKQIWENLPSIPTLGIDQSITFDSSNNIYLAYQDIEKQTANVLRFDGKVWTPVYEKVSENLASDISIHMSPTDIPYVSYKDITNKNKATVMKLGYNNE